MSYLGAVLLVEDDENDVLLFQRAARQAAIQNPVMLARDGQEAIDYLSGREQFADRARFPFPCLMVLDIKMPRKTGLDVLEWMSGEADIGIVPVVVFSSSTRAEDVERAYRLGANAFLVKPSSVERRAELARAIKSFWLDFNLPPDRCLNGLSVPLSLHATPP
jgi:CheY-like chemotaxis protein